MFKCDNCGEQSKPGNKCTKIVIETKEKSYKHFFTKGLKDVVVEGKGHETVKEVKFCTDCMKDTK